MHNDNSEQTAPNEHTKEAGKTSQERIPKQPWEHHANQESEHKHVPVLERKDWIVFEVIHFFHPGFLFSSNHHPSNVRPKESFENAVRIILGIGDKMVTAVVTAPFDG